MCEIIIIILLLFLGGGGGGGRFQALSYVSAWWTQCLALRLRDASPRDIEEDYDED